MDLTHRLDGRRCVVTGGGTGIGRASVLRFAAEGARVLVMGRRAAPLDDTVEQVLAAGGEAVAFVGDANDEGCVADAVATCARLWGGLDAFLANAGSPGTNATILDQTVEEWQTVWRDNVLSSMLAIKHAGSVMGAQGSGSIVLVSSVASLRANAGAISYSAAKAAVSNLAMTAANAFAGTAVRVNAILPGLVRTPMTAKVFEYAQARGKSDRIGHMTPLRRTGEPHEIAAMAAFLVSDDASFVTGQCYAVDGGVSSTHPQGRVPL